MMNKIKSISKLGGIFLILFFGVFSAYVLAEEQGDSVNNKIEKVDFLALPGGRVAVKVQTSQPLKNPPAGFTLNNPPRIALDFPNTGNGLPKSSLSAEQGALKSINLAQAKERTRMVLNLSKTVAYSTSI